VKVTETALSPARRTEVGAIVTDCGPALAATVNVPCSGRLASADESPTYAVNAPSGTTYAFAWSLQ
jgi:hypothetical protein